jgi:hypothetical protein
MGTSRYFHYVLLKSLSYGWKQRPCEALNATLRLHPLASASCCSDGIVTATVTTTTPNTASADTMAITIITVVVGIKHTSCRQY